MDRPQIFNQEQGRSYDFLWGFRSAMIGLGNLEQDIAGATTTVVSGLAASATTPTASLVVNLAAGRIYQNAVVDATSYGSLTSDSNLIQQQGSAAAQSVTLSTSGLTSGQSRWALIQIGYAQVDSIPASDPTAGLLYYFNSSSPSTPYQGPGGDGQPQNTLRSASSTVSVVYGAVATTGDEVPPNPSSGSVPLYLIDLAYGQTEITSGDILVAGPSVGTGVPSDYPYAPFLAGLLNSHHNGTTGQAPKINLATETTGNVPGQFLGQQSFYGAGTYSLTFPTGCNKVILAIQAAGGGSGGVGYSPTYGATSGGGAGAYALASMSQATANGANSLVLGAVGTAGTGATSGSQTSGGTATESTFGSTLIVVPGGKGSPSGNGQFASSVGPSIGATAGATALPTTGAGVTAILLQAGADGEPGQSNASNNSVVISVGGKGATSQMGAGAGYNYVSTDTITSGTAGVSAGSGASGAAFIGSYSSGGNGAAGGAPAATAYYYS